MFFCCIYICLAPLGVVKTLVFQRTSNLGPSRSFLISQLKHVVGAQKNRLNETVCLITQKYMFKLMGKKIKTILSSES